MEPVRPGHRGEPVRRTPDRRLSVPVDVVGRRGATERGGPDRPDESTASSGAPGPGAPGPDLPGPDLLGPFVVEHGEDPVAFVEAAAVRAWGPAPGGPGTGWRGVPVQVTSSPDHDGPRVVLDVRPHPDGTTDPLPAPLPLLGPRTQDPELVQRAGAYAVVVQSGQILMSRYRIGGRWGLPGGGLDPAEDPASAVRRETFEETGTALTGVRLVALSADRVSLSRGEQGRDFHTVRFVYRAQVPRVSTPQVVEIGGSTDLSRWIDLAELPHLHLAEYLDDLLPRVLPGDRR